MNSKSKGVLSIDGLHPSRLGNNLIDEEMAELLKRLIF
jgi:lysophospholipase L1-like esterase